MPTASMDRRMPAEGTGRGGEAAGMDVGRRRMRITLAAPTVYAQIGEDKIGIRP